MVGRTRLRQSLSNLCAVLGLTAVDDVPRAPSSPMLNEVRVAAVSAGPKPAMTRPNGSKGDRL